MTKHIFIVVHGIGEQKPLTTLTPVINRFAAWQFKDSKAISKFKTLEVVTRTQLLNMADFDPEKPPFYQFPDLKFYSNTPSQGTFEAFNQRLDLPNAAKPQTSDILFTELYWADLLNHNRNLAGAGMSVWTDSLIQKVVTNQKKSTPVTYFLKAIKGLLGPLQFLMKWRDPKLEDLVVNRFLGDVQMYAEHAGTKKRAIKRFNDVLKICQEQNPDADIHIIAHSLGSVLTMESICRAARRNLHNWLKPNWLKQVTTVVTLGSPIDKFLTIWEPKYEWLDNSVSINLNQKINHLNFADEQDPVGHQLDIFRQTKAYKNLFLCKDDQVFTRYVIPGVAHNLYWTDQPLFERIFNQALRPKADQGSVFPSFKPISYLGVLSITYLLLPLIYAILMGKLLKDCFPTLVLPPEILTIGHWLKTYWPHAIMLGIFCHLNLLLIKWRQFTGVKTSVTKDKKRPLRKQRTLIGWAVRVLMLAPIILFILQVFCLNSGLDLPWLHGMLSFVFTDPTLACLSALLLIQSINFWRVLLGLAKH